MARAQPVTRWLLGALLSGVVVMGTGVLAAPAAASILPASHLPAAGLPASNAAAEAARAVTSFRRSMRAELTGYLTRYGPRLSAAERARVDGVINRSDSHLNQVARHTRAAAQWEGRGDRSRALRQATAAATAAERAYQQAELAIAELTPILEPKLGLFEGLDAQAALTTRMRDYRTLVDQIRAVPGQLR